MKIKTTICTLLCLMIFFMQIVSAQYPCDPATAATNLDVNNVNATITNGANLWGGSYIVPKPNPSSGLPEISAIASGGIWIGGIDEGDNLKVAGSIIGGNAGEGDFFPGPLTEYGITDLATCNNYDRIWSVTNAAIVTHKNDLFDNGMIDGPVPPAILEWPAKGNPFFLDIFGFELPDTEQGLAPFEDNNFDGIYNPIDGDVPDIRGASQAHWMIFNDVGAGATEYPLRFEVQVLAYSFVSPDPALFNTTFYDYKFINRAIETLDSTYVGIWIDPDLGCPSDDYVGCFPEDNMAFIYNQDAVDGEDDCSCPEGVDTYCDDIPVLGVRVLRGPIEGVIINEDGNFDTPPQWAPADTFVELKMSSFMVLDSSDLPTANSLGLEYFNLMSGTWPDGTPLTNGGTGYNPGSTDDTKFAYPGNPSDSAAWSMCSENTVVDPKMLLGVSLLRMEPGDEKEIIFAVVYSRDVTHPCPDLTELQNVGNIVDEFEGSLFTSVEQAPHYKQSNLILSPNPFTNQTQLRLVNQNEQLSSVQVYSINGQLMQTYNSLSANSLTIEKGNLTTGMYFYKAATKNGKNYSGKFVVN